MSYVSLPEEKDWKRMIDLLVKEVSYTTIVSISNRIGTADKSIRRFIAGSLLLGYNGSNCFDPKNEFLCFYNRAKELTHSSSLEKDTCDAINAMYESPMHKKKTLDYLIELTNYKGLSGK